MDRSTFQPETSVVREHPAVCAWLALRSTNRIPEVVQALRTRRRKFPNDKSQVYRLLGIGAGGAPIIAKRSRRATMRVERFVYQEVLPLLPLTSLHCYGFFEEPDDACWLFLEDAGSVMCSESSPAHRILMAEWLATMHGRSAQLEIASRLPPLTLDRYHLCLQRARRRIRQNLSNPVLDCRQVAVLQAIIEHCDLVESHWSEITRFCDAMPRCLVHNDFIPKNVRVRSAQDGVAGLFVLDWEKAGWGMPAEDLSGIDMAVYHARVREYWNEIDLNTLEEAAAIGRIFQMLCFIAATSPGLAHNWTAAAASQLELYESWLAEAHRRMWNGL